MASHQDVQELLRMLTTGRGKIGMMPAMARIKALQVAGLRSLADIAAASLQNVKEAIGDDKAAKQLHQDAKNRITDPSAKKRRASIDDVAGSRAKRKKSAYELIHEPESPAAREASLALPEASQDIEEISKAVLYVNRAPLLLTFVLVLLKFTRPEQPPSSRLSLAQALVSANARNKAVSLSLEKGGLEQQGGRGHGQPQIEIMGRAVYVLKRGDYDVPSQGCSGDDESSLKLRGLDRDEDRPAEITGRSTSEHQSMAAAEKAWTTSQSITFKHSTFVARSIAVSSSAEATRLRDQLLATNAGLRDASHNITAWRVRGEERCDDDGESGGGRHILQILRETDIDGVLVVVTRWYGGVFLGPDRWRIMSDVCRDVLSQRLRVRSVSGEALWALDIAAVEGPSAASTTGMPIHDSARARAYILQAFACAPEAADPKRKKTAPAIVKEKERNLGLLLGALELLFASWAESLSRDELDRRAWSWYAQIRPEVSEGVSGWGAKGEVKLSKVLDLRRQG